MNPYDFIHLSLLALDGPVRGRTKLQKTIYFLGILTGNLDDLGYRAHYFGPYSDTVAGAVNQLKSLGFVQQTTLGTGSRNVSGFEIARHDYCLTDEGRSVACQKAEKNPDAWAKIQAATRQFLKAGDIDYMKMSVAAKTFFLISRKGQPATIMELSESAKAIGWEPKPEEIADSVGFLENLGLASTAK